MLRKSTFTAMAVLLAASAVLYVGCSGPEPGASTESEHASSSATASAAAAPTAKAEEHGHKPGGHGGIIVEIGRDSYHAEAVFEKGATLRLYTLGKDEAKIQEVDSQVLTAYVKSEGGSESVSFQLQPVPQAGDADGKTSQFLGRLPKELAGQRLEVTIPSIRIAGERFRLGFASANEAHADADMPSGISAEEEKDLYLTPGGKYTEADIKANGNTTAAQKFKGIKSKHNAKPKPGDKICPISMTLANPKFTWVIGGKAYEFCCPPCVDEFVKTAKEHPEEVKDPKDYVKQ